MTWTGALLILASPVLLLVGGTLKSAGLAWGALAAFVVGMVLVVIAFRAATREMAAVQSRFEIALQAEAEKQKREQKPGGNR
jgi:hypothetical protein